MKIIIDDLSGPAIAAFLEAHLRHMQSMTPPESKHALDLDALRKPDVTFWSAMEGEAVVGCGAIKEIEPGHAELKSMRTDPARRRGGIASRLLEHILAEATRTGFTRISLETGSAEAFEPARRLYLRYGFDFCGPFGDYTPDPLSVFMTRAL